MAETVRARPAVTSAETDRKPTDGRPVDALLTVRGLCATFGGIEALVDVDLDLPAHGCTAIIGPNGAGKTTLLNSICGLNPRNVRGHVALGDSTLSDRRPTEVAAAGVGRSFQNPPLLDGETVLDNVLLGMHRQASYGVAAQVFRPRRARVAEDAARSRAMALLSELGLASIAESPVGGLPYGTRKQIDIVRAAASDPVLLLLDEPTSGLDRVERASVEQLLRAIRRTRTSILFVEHHLDFVRAVATDVVALVAGSVFAAGPAGEVLDSETFRAALTGTDQRTRR